MRPSIAPMPISERIVGVVEEWHARFGFPCQPEWIGHQVGVDSWTVRLMLYRLVREGRLARYGDDVTIGGVL